MTNCIKEMKYELDSNYLRVVDLKTGEVIFCGYFEANNYLELTTICQNMWLYKPILAIHPRIYSIGYELDSNYLRGVGSKLILEILVGEEQE